MDRLRPAVDWLADVLFMSATAGYLALCVVLGGASRENALFVLVPQLVGVLLLLWLVSDRELSAPPKAAAPIAWMAGAFLALAVASLAPLPPALWAELPGRTYVLEGFRALGLAAPALPFNLAPAAGLSTILQLIGPFCVFMLACRIGWRDALAPMAWFVPTLALASFALGLFQVFTGVDSPAYLYDFVNRGQPIGFFANANHQASFLIMALPFVAALIARLRLQHRRTGSETEKIGIAVVLALMLVAGVILVGSIAGYLLLAPALVGSLFVALGGKVRWGGLLAMLLVVGGLAGLLASNPLVLNAATSIDGGPTARAAIFSNSLRAISEFMPAGSGLGSFETVYRLYEDPRGVTSTFVNHAHSDLLEVILELGAPGIVLLAAFLVWFLAQASRIWREEPTEASYLRRAATVALGCVLLHSLIDYPLRTTALASMAALCVAAMVLEKRRAGPVEGETLRVLKL